MSWDFYFHPEYKAPYRSDDVEESCVLAYNYFSMILDDFVEELPEYRQCLKFINCLAKEPTLAEKVHLIFPSGFGEFDEEKNHNPFVWPAVVNLSDAVRDGTTDAFAKEICEYFQESIDPDGECKDQMQMLQRIFDYITSYLQLFVILSDGDSINPDFKYPPEDVGGVLLGSRYRKPEYSEVTPGFAAS